MFKIKKKDYSKILFFLCLLILSSALIIEYVFGYQPCNLCLIERIPYVISLMILIISFSFKKNQIFFSVLLMLIFSFSILISIYHFSIEQGFIEESTLCISENLDLITKDEVLKSLQSFKISCKDVAFKIFGLSLTTYNIFISIFMFLLSIKIYLHNNDIKK